MVSETYFKFFKFMVLNYNNSWFSSGRWTKQLLCFFPSYSQLRGIVIMREKSLIFNVLCRLLLRLRLLEWITRSFTFILDIICQGKVSRLEYAPKCIKWCILLNLQIAHTESRLPLVPEDDVPPGESPLVEARVWESYLFAKSNIYELLIMIEKCRGKEGNA